MTTEREKRAREAALACANEACRNMDGELDLQAMAQHFLAFAAEQERHGEQRAIARLTMVSREIAWQAGVGGRETAGAIVSYLATSPNEIGPFVAGELSPLDFAGDWMRGGCLSWHSVRGDIVHPEDLPTRPATPTAKEDGHGRG